MSTREGKLLERKGKDVPGPALTYTFGSALGIGLVRFVPCPRYRKFTTFAPAANIFGGVDMGVRYDREPVLVSM